MRIVSVRKNVISKYHIDLEVGPTFRTLKLYKHLYIIFALCNRNSTPLRFVMGYMYDDFRLYRTHSLL